MVEGDHSRRAAIGRLPARIAFLGFGLIGGSIALALREVGYGGSITAWSPSGDGPAEGARRGLIDATAVTSGAAVQGADLVILAGPPLAVTAELGNKDGAWRARLADDATVTDVVSTKGRVVELAEAAGLRFVGGHPMAGRETTGVGSAAATLFVDRPWVIVPTTSAREVDLDRVTALAEAAGARPIRMTAAEHDRSVAAISHLPLVAAAALVESVALAGGREKDWPVARALAATGWADMTRLARGDPEMGAGILETNRVEVATHLRTYRDALDAWLEALDGGTDVAALGSRLEAAREALGGR